MGRRLIAAGAMGIIEVETMRVGFIGAGAMAAAIAGGMRGAGDQQSPILLYDTDQEAAARLAASVGGLQVDSVESLLAGSDMAVLAVKPQVQPQVLKEVAAAILLGSRTPLLSIAAGRSLDTIGAELTGFGAPQLPPLIRVMPNVNAQVGASMSAVAFRPEVTQEVREGALAIFRSIGECLELPESLFDVFSALAACSPAWFFQIVDTLARAGVKHGLTKEQAVAVANQAMLGSALTLQAGRREDKNPAALIDQVCSPGGTTIAGLLAAQGAGLDRSLVEAVDAAVKRDRELG